MSGVSAIHTTHFNGKARSLLGGSAECNAFPFFALAKFFSLHDPGGVPKLDPDRLLQFLITNAFRRKGIAIPEGHNSGNFKVRTTLVPSQSGSSTEFTRSGDEPDVDGKLFLLCERLNIKLYHGCLQNPQDPNDIAQRGLTRHGLERLKNEINEEELALLFRDGYIYVIHKNDGRLLLLETDAGKEKDAMWRLLTMERSQEILFSNLYHPIVLASQPNREEASVVEFIKEWTDAKEAAVNAFLKGEDMKEEQKREEQKKAKKIKKQKSAAKKKATGSGHEDVKDNARNSENNESSTAQGTEIPSPGHLPDLDEYEWAKGKFKKFLKGFLDKEDEAEDPMAFYERMVTGWKALKAKQRPKAATIYFPHVEIYDKELAFAILTDRSRLHDALAQVFLDFRVEIIGNQKEKEQLKGKVKLRFLSMPSIWLFEDFLKSSNAKIIEHYTLYDGATLKETAYVGRKSGKGYVDYLLENHMNGISWDGKISKSDLIIKNGRYEIRKAPNMVVATIKNMCQDFMKLIELLFELYNIKCSDDTPAYLDAFQTEILNMEQYTINTRDFRVFQRYLSHHLAFKAPLVRACLFIEVWNVIQSQRPIDANGKRDAFCKLQTKCKGSTSGHSFFENMFKEGWFFLNVHDYDNPSGRKYDDAKQIQFLELIRHLEVHLTDHTRDRGSQLLPDIKLVDLMIEDTFKDLVSTLVCTMMLDLDDAPFSSAWRHYEMFECGDELQNIVSESGNEKEVQSGGSLPSVVGSGSNTEESSAPPASAASSVSLASLKIESEEDG